MVSSIFVSSVGFYVFYALQPYLLILYGDSTAYIVAGLAATLVAMAQICGGLLASRISHLFGMRTTALIALLITSSIILISLYLTSNFYVALFLVFLWGLIFAARMPIRQAYLNGMIPSKQRATVLSFDSMIGNTGGIIIQPVLARSADVWSYGTSFAIGAAMQLIALPALLLSRSYKNKADKIDS